MNRATWIRFLQSAETLCSPLAILRGTARLSPTALTLALLYCCALYHFCFSWNSSVSISRWYGTSDFHWFGFWSRARSPDSATCAGLRHGRNYSFCIASEQKWQKGSAFTHGRVFRNRWTCETHTLAFNVFCRDASNLNSFKILKNAISVHLSKNPN